MFNILLQVLDDGHITDSQGRKVDFCNTVIIMTSNAGAQSIIDPKKLGFNTREDAAGDYKRMKSNVMNEVKLIFRPEFLNRLDEIIMFKPLTKDNIGSIVDLMMKDLNQRLADQEITLELDPSAKDYIIDGGYDPVYGARPLKRYLQKNVETLAAKLILSGKVGMEDTIVFTVRDGELTADVKPKAETVTAAKDH